MDHAHATATLLSPAACNGCCCRFGPLGSWRVSVRGSWRDCGDGCSEVAFREFSVRPVEFLGLNTQVSKLQHVPHCSSRSQEHSAQPKAQVGESRLSYLFVSKP